MAREVGEDVGAIHRAHRVLFAALEHRIELLGFFLFRGWFGLFSATNNEEDG